MDNKRTYMDQQSKPNQGHQNNNIHHLLFPKRSWTKEEDELLEKLVEKYGAQRWSHIAKLMPHRIGKQCRQRWCNHLNPNIKKQDWSSEQQWILFLGHHVLDSKWAKLTKTLPGRTDNSIKNHWNSIMKKKLPKYQQKFDREIKDLSLSPQQNLKQIALTLLQKYCKNNVNELYEQIQTKSNIHSEAQIYSPNLQKERSFSDELSFSNILRKMDENDKLKSQQSYKYNDSNKKSKDKRSKWASNSIKEGGNIEKDQDSNQKQNNLKSIQDLLEDQQQIILPMPLRRLSSLDYKTLLSYKSVENNDFL